jgi:hypothetical protein
MVAAAKPQNDDLVQRRKRERYMRTTCPACTRLTIQPLGYPSSEIINASPASPAGVNVVEGAEAGTSFGSSSESSKPQATRSESIPLNIPSALVQSPAPVQVINALHSSALPKTVQQTSNATSCRTDPPKPSKRQKKKSGLAEMIARSKAQDQDRKKQANKGGSGLAAFLSGL